MQHDRHHRAVPRRVLRQGTKTVQNMSQKLRTIAGMQYFHSTAFDTMPRTISIFEGDNMATLDWTPDNLAATLKPLFLLKVRENFRDKNGKVRFGITGTGKQPNYQYTYRKKGTPSDRPVEELKEGEAAIVAYRGNSHKTYKEAEAFNDERISGYFTYEDIDRAYQASKEAPQ